MGGFWVLLKAEAEVVAFVYDLRFLGLRATTAVLLLVLVREILANWDCAAAMRLLGAGGFFLRLSVAAGGLSCSSSCRMWGGH